MDPGLTFHGDCIIGIYADKGAADLDRSFKKVLQQDNSLLITHLTVKDCTVEVHSRGSSHLPIADETDHVWRKSRYICDRTIGICSDHVAATLPRRLVKLLQAGNDLVVEMIALTPEKAL